MQETLYRAARDAINNRVKLRDNVLIFYLAAISAIFGAAFGTNVNTDLLLMVPFIALGVSFMFAQHHTTIGSIVDYLAFEHPLASENSEKLIHWDVSNSATSNNQRSMFLILLSPITLIAFPAAAALIYKIVDFCTVQPSLNASVVFGLGWVSLAWTIRNIFIAHKHRTEINNRVKNSIAHSHSD